MGRLEQIAVLSMLALQSPDVEAGDRQILNDEQTQVSRSVKRVVSKELGSVNSKNYHALVEAVIEYEGEPSAADVSAVSLRLTELAYLSIYSDKVVGLERLESKGRMIEEIAKHNEPLVYYMLLASSPDVRERGLMSMFDFIHSTTVDPRYEAEYSEYLQPLILAREEKFSTPAPNEDFWDSEWQYLNEMEDSGFKAQRIGLWLNGADLYSMEPKKLEEIIDISKDFLKTQQGKDLFSMCLEAYLRHPDVRGTIKSFEFVKSLLLDKEERNIQEDVLDALEGTGAFDSVNDYLIDAASAYSPAGYAFFSVLYYVERNDKRVALLDKMMEVNFSLEWLPIIQARHAFDFHDLNKHAATRAGLAVCLMRYRQATTYSVSDVEIRKQLMRDGILEHEHGIGPRANHVVPEKHYVTAGDLEGIAQKKLRVEGEELLNAAVGEAYVDDLFSTGAYEDLKFMSEHSSDLFRDAFAELESYLNPEPLLDEDYEMKYQSFTDLLEFLGGESKSTTELVIVLEKVKAKERQRRVSDLDSYALYEGQRKDMLLESGKEKHQRAQIKFDARESGMDAYTEIYLNNMDRFFSSDLSDVLNELPFALGDNPEAVDRLLKQVISRGEYPDLTIKPIKYFGGQANIGSSYEMNQDYRDYSWYRKTSVHEFLHVMVQADGKDRFHLNLSEGITEFATMQMLWGGRDSDRYYSYEGIVKFARILNLLDDKVLAVFYTGIDVPSVSFNDLPDIYVDGYKRNYLSGVKLNTPEKMYLCRVILDALPESYFSSERTFAEKRRGFDKVNGFLQRLFNNDFSHGTDEETTALTAHYESLAAELAMMLGS